MLKHQLGHIESLSALIMDLDADIKKTESINWQLKLWMICLGLEEKVQNEF